MAVITFQQPGNMLANARFAYGQVTSATPTSITITVAAGYSDTYYGAFTYSATDLAGGRVTGYQQIANHRPGFSVTDVNIDALAIKHFMETGNALGLIHFVTSGADRIEGSSGADVLTGYRGADVLSGHGGSDTLYGGDGDDQLRGGGGNDGLVGDGGLDVAFYVGVRAQYTVVRSGSGYQVSDKVAGRDGADTLALVERLQFGDGRIALDIEGAAGQAFRLYRAAFDRIPDEAGLGFHMAALDRSAPLVQVADGFAASPEFGSSYGPLDAAGFVARLYRNVLDREPDAAGHAYHVGRLAAGVSRGEVLVGFSESPENKAAVIGVIENGIAYQ